jgi:exoribonuclease R
LDKKKDFEKGYKHDVEIWKKNRAKAKHKNKVFIKNLHDENEELKGSTIRQKVKIWETIERKWIKHCFFIRNKRRFWLVRLKH